MCGIAGYIGQRNVSIKKMLAAIQHRGPDETNVWESEGIKLGINRLSIIDPSGECPPHWNENRTCCVVCNGEIYNYRALKKDLIQRGHQFRTESDTEVIIHLYEEFGEHAPEHLRGMFAFALYDIPGKKLLLARDRFGEKPLYFFHKNDDFAFGSELAAILTLPDFIPRLNIQTLPQFISTGFVTPPETLLENVCEVLPGAVLVFGDGQVKSTPYFELSYHKNVFFENISGTAARFKPIWSDAVQHTLTADAEVGALLSGGIDSAAVVAEMAAQSTKPFPTFHIRMEGQMPDESGIAREVARYFGTEHHEITLPAGGFDEALFDEVLAHSGFPTHDAAAVPLYLISREVRKYVKVALSGDGGDEMFAGYDYYRRAAVLSRLQQFPRTVLSSGKLISNALGTLVPNRLAEIFRKSAKVFDLGAMPEEDFFTAYFGLFSIQETQKMLRSKMPVWKRLPKGAEWNHQSLLRQMIWYSTRYNLPQDLLVKTDRMSMAHGLEIRTPFLDKTIYEFASTLPDHLLMNRHRGKLVLREMLKNKLPDSVFSHPKTGFVTPLHTWLNDDFRKLAKHQVEKPGPLDEVLDKKIVWQHIEKGIYPAPGNSSFRSGHRAWQLVQLYAWVDRFKITL